MSQKQSPPGFFYKALTIAPLSSDAKAVGGALFDHFNTKTGQCDPSQESLARRLGIARRTIIDAIDELEHFGLFARLRHGGNGYRSAYKPNFPLASLMVADFERRRKAGVAPAETSTLHPKNRPPKRSRRGKTSGDGAPAFGRESSGDGATSASGTCAAAPSGTVATQTLGKNNSSNLTRCAQPEKSHSSGGGSLAVGQRTPAAPRPPSEAAWRRAKAADAWQRDLLRHSRDLYKILVPGLSETDAAYVEATSAELARPGGGLASILATATPGRRSIETKTST